MDAIVNDQSMFGRDALLRKAEAFVPIIAERAERASRDRTVPPETIAEFSDAGFYRALQPKRHGGLEVDPNTYFDIVSIIGQGCMSSAWTCAVQGSTPFLIAQFSEEAKDDIWGKTPSALVAGQLLPTKNVVFEKQGYRITGQWPYVSGCRHSDWYVVGGIAPEGSPHPGDHLLFMVPRSDCQIVDTWHVSGLKGSGSDDVAANDVFVPHHRVIRYEDAMAGNGPGIALNTGSIYHVPFAQIFAYGLSTTAVGALRGMLNLFLKHGGARVAVHGAKTSEDPVAQLLCAETVCALDEIELTRRRNFDAMMADSLAGRLSRLEERRHYKFQAAYSVERCTLLGARIFKASGASAIFDRLPFARILADMQAGRQHVACQWESIGRNWGAHMLGGTTRPDGMV